MEFVVNLYRIVYKFLNRCNVILLLRYWLSGNSTSTWAWGTFAPRCRSSICGTRRVAAS